MKKNMMILGMTIVMAGLLAGCSNTESVSGVTTENVDVAGTAEEIKTIGNTDQTVPDASVESPDTEEAEETVITDAGNIGETIERLDSGKPDAAYEEIIQGYQTALKEQWDWEKIEENGYSGMLLDFYGEDASKEIGYVLYDLDLDGVAELLIGETDTEEVVNRIILDAYTLENGQAKQIFTSESRDRYYIVGDEGNRAVMIAEEASNSAANSGWFYYILSDGKLDVMQAILYDAAADEEKPWFMTYDTTWDPSNGESVEESFANAIIDSYTGRYAALPWIALSDAK